jgi:ferritin-like protein
MQVLADDAIWKIADTAKEAAQAKSEWLRHFARTAAEVAVDVVANFTTEDLTEEDRGQLIRHAMAIAAERLSDLVGDLAEDLADKYL